MEHVANFFIVVFFLGAAGQLSAEPISAALKGDQAKAVGLCKASLVQVDEAKKRIFDIKDPGKTPGFFASSDEKKKYAEAKKRFDDRALNLQAFAVGQQQLKSFYSKETANLDKATSGEHLRDLIRMYNTNCGIFSDGLLKFSDSVVYGKAAPTYERIFDAWRNEVKCGKLKCP